ncbi:MAG: hypothetical protein FWB89_02190 [Treponema sp.]|nr:hypothetical protein [Treponema sp.]
MKKISVLLLLIFLLVFFSCKTNRNQNTENELLGFLAGRSIADPEHIRGNETKKTEIAVELYIEPVPKININEPEIIVKPANEQTIQTETVQQPAAQPIVQAVQSPETSQLLVQEATAQPPEIHTPVTQSPVQEAHPVQPPVAQQSVQTAPPVQTIQPITQAMTQPPVQQTIQPPVQIPEAAQTSEPEIVPLVRTLRDALSDTKARDRYPTAAQPVTEPQEGEIIFSRIVRAAAGQIIEIPFNGTGWVYLGELLSQRGLIYNSRRLDPQGQSFIFTAEEAGSYALKFYKQDFIKDFILNDHVRVIVGEAPAAEGTGWFNPPSERGRVVANPRWPSAEEDVQIQRSGAELSFVNQAPLEQPSVREPISETVRPQTQGTLSAAQMPQTPSVQQPVNDQGMLPREILLQRAKEAVEGGNISGAITLLNQYTAFYSEYPDEILWLYGQSYEANTADRNILLSLDYYRRLVREYPQSARYNDARRRIAYLERFYINIQ